ncbi:immunity 49 family protein [Nonomuraea terrae]|uniref:immunity 49 family protein n=1 Tax=Nonomuraea terrae TaxID=2530383 RepID=UPI001CB6F8B2|nr:immunity 49 family protein [Nonomuraea terrae]
MISGGQRHEVREATVAAAREGFADRIGSMVRSMAKAGPMTAYEWWLICEEFLDYLGALSAGTPDLDTPEARAAFGNAAEAAAGAVAYAAYHPFAGFSVYLDYVDFGITYGPEPGGTPQPITADRWLDAFCLAVLAGTAERHGEAFHFARGTAQEELVDGLMAYVIGDTEEPRAATDATLPHATAVHALRALEAGDQETFRTALAELLLRHRALHGPGDRPRTLLPLLPLALAALAYRRQGWPPPETGYLPRALVTGFATAGPRVRAYGRERRPDAVAELAAGPVVVRRPGPPGFLHPESEALFEEYTREAFTPEDGKPLDPRGLSTALRYQELLFVARAGLSDDVTDGQLANLRLASQLGAALFRVALAEPGAGVEVTIDGRTLAYPAHRAAEPGTWHTAVNFALITGTREDLAPVVVAGSAALRQDGSAFASYRRALHDYLRGADPEPATDQALHDCDKARTWGFFPPPAVLLAQLVEGDQESFNLALLDALDAHRDHYGVADRADDSEAAINLDVLALACHARRRGWDVQVVSPYLPAGLLRAARPR